MKWSKNKKEKMRKIRQKRVFKHCNSLGGLCVDPDTDALAIDQLKYGGKLYVAAEEKTGKVHIYWIVDIGNYVRLSPGRVSNMFDIFSNPDRWRYHSAFRISETGVIAGIRPRNRRFSAT